MRLENARRNFFDMDFYSILGIDEDASQEDVKKAYQQLVLKHHPDKVSVEEFPGSFALWQMYRVSVDTQEFAECCEIFMGINRNLVQSLQLLSKHQISFIVVWKHRSISEN
jgi:hypothetical protein